MLTLTEGAPEVNFAAGDVVVTDGGTEGILWVLVTGHLVVHKGGMQVNTVERPGAMVGEISILLGQPYGATVTASTPSVLRRVADGRTMLANEPSMMEFVAVGLAERLHFVTAYLADLQHQYGDAPGLAMVPDVLRRLSDRQGPPVEPGSLRDPDPEY